MCETIDWLEQIRYGPTRIIDVIDFAIRFANPIFLDLPFRPYTANRVRLPPRQL